MQAVLEGLKSLPVPLKLPAAPCSANIIDEAACHLGVLEAAVLFGRYGKGSTREELASQLGLQRDEVSQAEIRALSKIWARAAAFREPLGKLFKAVSEAGFAVFELAEEASQYFPAEQPETAWRLAVQTYAKATGQQFVLRRLPESGWALYDPERVAQDTAKLESLFRTEPAFRSVEDAAEQLGIDAYDLLLGWRVYDALYLTRAGLLGFSGWTEPERSVAVAAVLAAAGITEPEPSGLVQAHGSEGGWQAALALFHDFGEPEWTALLTGLADNGVPAPALDDILCDLTRNGRTTGHTALALWRQGEAILALTDAAGTTEADAELIRVTTESDPVEIARLINEFTGG